jgi:hypothetical protein
MAEFFTGVAIAASFTQLIANISGGIDVTRRKIDEFRNADSHIRTVRHELGRTASLIHSIEEQLTVLVALEREEEHRRQIQGGGGHEAQARELDDPLGDIRGQLESLKTLMGKFVVEGEINRWVWLYNATKCKSLVQELIVHQLRLGHFFMVLKM